jgi:hypothetical protein
MLYITTLHLNECYLAAALAAAIGFVVISLIKEKSDERKRA